MRRVLGRVRVTLTYVVLAAAVCGVSIAVALIVTPPASVSALGQTMSVGAATPTLTLSGPGELELFGQQLPTTVDFNGPVRPRLVLEHVTIDRQLASLFRSQHHPNVTASLGKALADGWTRYFIWETLVAGGIALLLIGALAGWWRVPWRRALVLLVSGLVLVEAVNIGAVMFAAAGAQSRLRQIGSLEALVGRAPLRIPAPTRTSTGPKVDAVVLGDSTAAGLGNPPLPHATAQDIACGRSEDSYARSLATVNNWRVVNLACSGATIDTGLLGRQHVGPLTLPPQVRVAATMRGASVVIVSIGANDVGWSDMLRACAASEACANKAITAYFQQQLHTFATRYLQLLQALSTLRDHPLVVVNLYYDPFGPATHCLAHVGLGLTKQKNLVSFLDALNGVLAKGATAFSFPSVQPSFAGHTLCDPDPYVQGLGSSAPFHPTASGQLAIALADEQVILSQSDHGGPPATTAG